MEWDDHAAGWDDQPGTREYARAAFDSLVGVAADLDFDLSGATACDFGCGTGLLTEYLVERCETVDAIDSSPAMLAVLAAKIERGGWRNVETFEDLPGGAARYDLVVCSSVLAFVDDHPGTVRRLVAAMRPGGLFVQWDWELDAAADDPFGLTPDEIGDALALAGLVAVRVRNAFEIDAGGQLMRPLVGTGTVPR